MRFSTFFDLTIYRSNLHFFSGRHWHIVVGVPIDRTRELVRWHTRLEIKRLMRSCQSQVQFHVYTGPWVSLCKRCLLSAAHSTVCRCPATVTFLGQRVPRVLDAHCLDGRVCRLPGFQRLQLQRAAPGDDGRSAGTRSVGLRSAGRQAGGHKPIRQYDVLDPATGRL